MGVSNSSKKEERENELYTGHASQISESDSMKLFNSIVRIEKGEGLATGFFMKIKINENNKNFLLTCQHVITQEDVDSKKNINIFYGQKDKETKKNIKLDIKERFIKCF